MIPTGLQFWLTFQMALESLLIIFMVIFFVRLRRLGKTNGRPSEQLESSVENFLVESQKLSERFSKNLNEKREISLNLLLKLERKINEMNQLLQEAEDKISKTSRTQSWGISGNKENPAAPESRALVLKLDAKGLSIEEIANKSRLHRGEVELILDLERQFEL